jgi:hypothetical protein
LIGVEASLKPLHPWAATETPRRPGTSHRRRRMRVGLRHTDSSLDLGVGKISECEDPAQRRIQGALGVVVGTFPRLQARDAFV